MTEFDQAASRLKSWANTLAQTAETSIPNIRHSLESDVAIAPLEFEKLNGAFREVEAAMKATWAAIERIRVANAGGD